MLLYLLRHGDADSSPLLADHERPLSMRGQKEIEGVARFLAVSKTTISLIVSSPLLRAQESSAIIQQSLQNAEILTSDSLVPGSNPTKLFVELSSRAEPAVLLVGHEPLLSVLISILISGSDASHIELKKGSLVCLAVQKPLQGGAGVLRWVLPVSFMQLATGP